MYSALGLKPSGQFGKSIFEKTWRFIKKQKTLRHQNRQSTCRSVEIYVKNIVVLRVIYRPNIFLVLKFQIYGVLMAGHSVSLLRCFDDFFASRNLNNNDNCLYLREQYTSIISSNRILQLKHLAQLPFRIRGK